MGDAAAPVVEGGALDLDLAAKEFAAAVVELPGVAHAPMLLDEAQISMVGDFLLAA